MIKEKIEIRINKKDKLKIKTIAENNNTTISQVIRDFINKNETTKKIHKNKQKITAQIYLLKDDLKKLDEIQKETNQSKHKIINNLVRKNLKIQQKLTDAEIKAIKKISFEVKKIGTNINTIARFCNEQTKLNKLKFPFSKKTELEPLLAQYQNLQLDIKKILHKIT